MNTNTEPRTTHGRLNSGKYGTTTTPEGRAAYAREWRKRNPAAVAAARIQQAINLLERNGYTVKKPGKARKAEATTA